MPATFDALLDAANTLLTDFGLLPVIAATAVVGIAAMLLRKMRSAAR